MTKTLAALALTLMLAAPAAFAAGTASNTNSGSPCCTSGTTTATHSDTTSPDSIAPASMAHSTNMKIAMQDCNKMSSGSAKQECMTKNSQMKTGATTGTDASMTPNGMTAGAKEGTENKSGM